MADLDQVRTQLFTSILSDCLDKAGLMHQALPSRIRPLDEACVMVGRARTAAFMAATPMARFVKFNVSQSPLTRGVTAGTPFHLDQDGMIAIPIRRAPGSRSTSTSFARTG